MDLQHRRTKEDMLKDIKQAFNEYEEYKKEKLDKYTRYEQLGDQGKEGTTYLVRDKFKNEYAMKTFRKTKASSTLKKEYSLQRKAGKGGVAPRVYTYDTVSKYIVMDKMDGHLYSYLDKHSGILPKRYQERILEIFRILDEIGIFHNDCNICNYMLRDKEIYLIDYGFAKEITPSLIKKLKTDKPNSTLMLIGFILKLKEKKVPEKSYKYLLKNLSKEDIAKYKL
jgi:predicted Ser/Thr protein kinase